MTWVFKLKHIYSMIESNNSMMIYDLGFQAIQEKIWQ